MQHNKVAKEYWDKVFKETKCKYCGKADINKKYIDYGCHSICERIANIK